MKTKKISLFNTLSMTMLLIITTVFVFPFYWVITGSFKNPYTVSQLPPEWFPTQFMLDSYVSLLRNPVLNWLYNSFFISLITMALVCVSSTMAGYALAKKRFYGKEILFGIIVAAMALPKQVVLVPLVRLVSAWGFHNTPWAVILPAASWPFGIFLMKQFSQIIPTELLEAAKIDGASEARVFTQIVFPMVQPGIAALAIFTFIQTWNDYFLQLIMLNSKTKLTLQLGIATLQSEFAINVGILMAGAVFAAIPIVVIFIVFQKYFTQGITMGAVKG